VPKGSIDRGVRVQQATSYPEGRRNLGLQTELPIHASNPASRFPPVQLRSADNLSALLHDTRNMVASIDLYCDLLEEPGVLSPSSRHFAGELRLVAGASRRLLQKLALLDCATGRDPGFVPQLEAMPSARPLEMGPSFPSPRLPVFAPPAGFNAQLTLDPPVEPAGFRTSQGLNHVLEVGPLSGSAAPRNRQQLSEDPQPIASLADELRANLSLVSAMAGPGISVGLSIHGGGHPIAMTSDDLTRVLINLASNSTQAMRGGGRIQIALDETSEHLRLTFSDTGCGIPETALEAVFAPGYTTHVSLPSNSESESWLAQHHGLGLPIVRSLVAAAGGLVWSVGRGADRSAYPDPATGALIVLQFPLNTGAGWCADAQSNVPPHVPPDVQPDIQSTVRIET